MPREAELRAKVRWRRYATAKRLVRAWRAVNAKELTEEQANIQAHPRLLREITRHKMWAFVDLNTEPPVVHYWHAPDVAPWRLAFMLGHELGHTTGKRLAHHHAEEDRADTYGVVAEAVFRRMLGARRKTSKRR